MREGGLFRRLGVLFDLAEPHSKTNNYADVVYRFSNPLPVPAYSIALNFQGTKISFCGFNLENPSSIILNTE